jgi:hypothetical protein
MWTGLVWLRMGTSGEFLWIRYWTLWFHEMLGNYRVAYHVIASRVVLRSVELVSLWWWWWWWWWLLLLLLFSWTANGFLPCGSATTVTYNTQIHISHKITHHFKQNTAHKAIQTIKDTLHTMNAIREEHSIGVKAEHLHEGSKFTRQPERSVVTRATSKLYCGE